MISKERAVESVESYLAKQNRKPNAYIFKTPVYNKIYKRIHLFFLKLYWKNMKQIELAYPEWHIKPDQLIESKMIEVVNHEYIKDLGICWSIPYCSKQYYDTGKERYGSIGGGPIFVDKLDGKMYHTGSAPIDWFQSFRDYKQGIKDLEEWPIWKSIQWSEEIE